MPTYVLSLGVLCQVLKAAVCLPWSQVVKARVLTQDLVARRLRLSLAAASAAAGADPLGGLQPGDVVQEGTVRSVVMREVPDLAQVTRPGAYVVSSIGEHADIRLHL